MPVDPADYPETTRGYPYPTLINDGGSATNAATDPPADLKRLADAIDADVAAVEAAAGSASGTVASDLAAHVADTTGVHGIADTSTLVVTTDPRLSDARTPIAHAASHGSAGSDPITVAQSQVTNLATDLAAKVSASLYDAKGDLLVGSANDTAVRLPVGVAGQLLVPDTSAAGGLAWKSLSDADVAQRSQIGNLLPEGFATSEDGVTVWRAAGGSPTITNDNTYARTGTRSQKIITTAIACIASPTAGIALSQRYVVQPGRRYTFATWVRADVAGENWITRLYWYDASNAAASTATTDGVVVTISTTGWTLVMTSGTAPADAAVCSPALVRSSGTIGASVWTDDSSFHFGVGGAIREPGGVVVGTQPFASVAVAKDGINQALSAAQPVVVNYGANVTYVLPNAVDNYGVTFTLINRGTGTVTVSRPGTDPRTVNGLEFSPTIPGKGQLQLVSTGDTWLVVSGEYVTDTVGKATYAWDHTANSTTPAAWWRLVAYDSGVRDITALMTNPANATVDVATLHRMDNWVQMTFGVTSTAATTGTLFTVDTGFRPLTVVSFSGGANSATQQDGLITSGTGGATFYRVWTATGSRRTVVCSYPTSRTTLPSSLPGTQVTAPA